MKTHSLDGIDKGVPIPASHTGPHTGSASLRGRLAAMEIGDSTRVEYAQRNSISGVIQYHQVTVRQSDRFTRRVMKDAEGEKYIRVWRIA